MKEKRERKIEILLYAGFTPQMNRAVSYRVHKLLLTVFSSSSLGTHLENTAILLF